MEVNLPTGALTNYLTEATRRVDMTFAIEYDDHIKKTKEVLAAIVTADDPILKDPSTFLAVSELAESSVNFTNKIWVNIADCWGVYTICTKLLN